MSQTFTITVNMDALYQDIVMENPTPPHTFFDFLSSAWGWVTGLLGGAMWVGKIQTRVQQLEDQHLDLKNLPVQVAKIEAKIDLLLQDRKNTP